MSDMSDMSDPSDPSDLSDFGIRSDELSGSNNCLSKITFNKNNNENLLHPHP